MPKKRVKKTAKKKVRYDKKRFSIAWKNFLFFLILSILFLVLYKVTTNVLLENTFGILWIVFGFIAVAFLLVVLVFLFLKSFRR